MQEDYFDDAFSRILPRYHSMITQMSTSVYGKFISIEYVLKCFIKHEGNFEFGEGAVASMPIQIL